MYIIFTIEMLVTSKETTDLIERITLNELPIGQSNGKNLIYTIVIISYLKMWISKADCLGFIGFDLDRYLFLLYLGYLFLSGHWRIGD